MKHWQLETDTLGYCWLTLDRADSSTNTLGAEVLEEFDACLTAFEQELPRGLVIKSGKKNGFIAGADISEFVELTSEAEAYALVRKVQLIFDKLAALPIPTVAMINGFCLGGGLELSLACKYRVALDDSKTKIGLPEVMLGVQPGWGGSVRLPHLIGSIKALSLILPGKVLDARQAAKMGIIDAAVPLRHFQRAVECYVQQEPPTRDCGVWERFVQLAPVRTILAYVMRQQLRKKVNPWHYPAPYSILDTWQKNSTWSKTAYEAEAKSIAKLMITSTARNLVRLFFLRDRLKSFAKGQKFAPRHVHVIGAGVMGGDIAAWCALRGFKVTLQDKNIDAISATFTRTQNLFAKKLKVPYLINAAKDRLVPDPTGMGVKQADVIIEAIIEDPAAKQQLFATLEKHAKPEAILATNTSTIPLDVIGQDLQRPERIVGIHFFNPVPLMQLVEVVSLPSTDKEVLNKALTFAGKIDKLPLPVQSCPGFLVNRVLVPYMLEAAEMYAEGVPGIKIDKAATDFGMLMGPIELMDVVGIDICMHAAEGVGATVPTFFKNWVAEGKLGKKAGKGFYNYDRHGKRLKVPVAGDKPVPNDIIDRLIMRLVNEAAACLREGVVADADLIDAGLVFGAGFAPFRGGPMTFITALEKQQVKDNLDALSKKYGERFTADPVWNGS